MWRDAAWVLDMLHAAQRARDHARDLTEAQFMTSTLHQDAILRQLTIVGEAAKRISMEFRTEHPRVPWTKIAGFRDVVVHDYFRVDLQEIWRILQEELPTLVNLLLPLVPPERE